MLINATKTKVMTNNDCTLEITVDGGRLEQVDYFTYLGSQVTSNADCVNDVKSRLTMGMAVMIKLTRLRKNKSVSTITKLRLMRALVWPVATYGCEARTLKKREERRIQAFENKCIRKLLRIPWTKLMTTAQLHKMAGVENELLNHIKSRKLRYFGHVMTQSHDNVESSVMVGLAEGVTNRGRQRMCWLDNICQWNGLSGDNLLYTVRDRLRVLDSSVQPTVAKRQRRDDMT